MADAAQKNPLQIPAPRQRPRRTPRQPTVSYRPRPRSAAVPQSRPVFAGIAAAPASYILAPLAVDWFTRWYREQFGIGFDARRRMGLPKPDSGGRRKPVRSASRQPAGAATVSRSVATAGNPLVNPVAKPAARPVAGERARAVVAPATAAAPSPRPAPRPAAVPKPSKAPVPAKSPTPRAPPIPGILSGIPASFLPFLPLSTPFPLTTIKPRGVASPVGQVSPLVSPLPRPAYDYDRKCKCPGDERGEGVYFVRKNKSGRETSIFWRNISASNASGSVGRRRRKQLESVFGFGV